MPKTDKYAQTIARLKKILGDDFSEPKIGNPINLRGVDLSGQDLSGMLINDPLLTQRV